MPYLVEPFRCYSNPGQGQIVAGLNPRDASEIARDIVTATELADTTTRAAMQRAILAGSRKPNSARQAIASLGIEPPKAQRVPKRRTSDDSNGSPAATAPPVSKSKRLRRGPTEDQTQISVAEHLRQHAT